MEFPEPFEDRIAEISLDLWTILKKTILKRTILKKTPFRDVNFPGKIIKFGRGVLENPIQFQDILAQNQTKPKLDEIFVTQFDEIPLVEIFKKDIHSGKINLTKFFTSHR